MIVGLFTAPETWPFGVAFALIVGIALIEGLGMLVSLSPSNWLDDLLPDIDGDTGLDRVLGWLYIGKVPSLVLLVLFLMGYAIFGYSLQKVAHGLLGGYLPVWLAGLVAVAPGMATVRSLGALIAHIIPRDETSAVSEMSLIGRHGVVSAGAARRGLAAQARVRDSPWPHPLPDGGARPGRRGLRRRRADPHRAQGRGLLPLHRQPAPGLDVAAHSQHHTNTNRGSHREMTNLFELGVIAAIALLALLTIGIVFARLYKRSTKETAFVRTGLGGQKVIMDGGAILLPVFHERVLVNMNTLKLEVVRRAKESLITKDRMRVDVTAAFFVRVKQTEEAVSIAAQTLGARTMSPEELKALVEDKFVDSLRATAATMTIQELQDKRRDFVQAVQNAVAEDLEKNGLELESVSLTSLDQTDKQFFNPNNAFDAEGLTRLTEQTEARRKQRNDVEQDTEVQVRTKDLEATRQKLTIEKDQEFASLSQKREIENTRAEQAALIATQQAERSREAEAAKIEAERQVSQKRIEAEREIKAAEIEKNLVIQTREIELERHTETKRAEQRKQVEIARQDTQIAIANKSREQSDADAAANLARAEAVKAEEAVNTARQVAVAERDKNIQLIEASKDAEQSAISVKVSASAEKEAALDRAEAITIEARARQAAALAEAEGKRALNEALNTLSAAQVDLQVRSLLLQQLPLIIQQAVRPMEKIDSIRIVQVGGLPGGSGGQGTGQGGSGAQGTFPEQVMNSALQYQIAKPIVDAVMKDAGPVQRRHHRPGAQPGRHAGQPAADRAGACQPRRRVIR